MASLDNVVSKLEKDGQDELTLLMEVGPEYFTTTDLIRLWGQWQIKYQLFDRFQRTLIWVGAAAPGWLIIGILAYFLKMSYLASFALVLFPVTAFLCFAGLIWMNHFFKSKGYLEQVETLIRDELKKRELDRMKNEN